MRSGPLRKKTDQSDLQDADTKRQIDETALVYPLHNYIHSIARRTVLFVYTNIQFSIYF